MSTISKMMVVAVILVLTVFGAASAEPMPVSEKVAPAPKVAVGEITDVQLGELLEGLGVEFTRGKYKSGAAYYDIKLPTKDYELNVRAGLSPNKRSIWLMAYLADVPENVPAERLRALLQAINTRTGKMQFRLVGNQLKADQPLDNVGVTAARLRREIDDFGAALQDTDKLWNTAKWTPPAVTAEAPVKVEK